MTLWVQLWARWCDSLSFPASLWHNSPCTQLFAVHVLPFPFLLFSTQACMTLGWKTPHGSLKGVSQSRTVTGGCKEYLFLEELLELGEQKKGGPTQQQKYLFLLVCCYCTLLTCYCIYGCVSGAGKVFLTSWWDPMGWDAIDQCEICLLITSSVLALESTSSSDWTPHFHRNASPVLQKSCIILRGACFEWHSFKHCSLTLLFSPFVACLLSFCSLFLPPYCSFICTPFVPCLKAVSNVSVQGIHCATTSQWKELPFRAKGGLF